MLTDPDAGPGGGPVWRHPALVRAPQRYSLDTQLSVTNNQKAKPA